MQAYTITPEQIKLIHTAKTKLGLDDDTYRDTLLSRFNVSSSKNLSYTQATLLIDLFRAKGFKPIRKKKATVKQNGKVIRIVSQAQKDLIEVLKANVVWHVENGYQAWLEKRMRIKNVLTARDANKVIEGLKNMVGIKTDIIEMRALPFPFTPEPHMFVDKKTGEISEVVWLFDLQTKRLVRCPADGEAQCTTT